MPNKTFKTLDAHIHQIVSQAAAEIAASVRAEFSAELAQILSGHGAPKVRASASAGRATHATPKAAAAHAPAKKAGAKRGRKSGPNAVTLDKIVATVRATPGLRSEQIQKVIGLPKEQVKAALAKLRETGRVNTVGTRRATTYSVG